ncbi:hypothetical protein GE061_019164 [Apolygus lucorum]|uniref:Uncharacterized protein n=1 Tax=Apolygus lucorum TaxID=248454 RepID=A0A6A4JGE3_APOLU|nr:hypothetical protein GE061_019164 [Apolygus lucorum]
MEKKEEKKDEKKEEKKEKKSLKHVGPILEVSAVKPGEKKQQKKTVVAASVAPAPEQPAPSGQPPSDVPHNKTSEGVAQNINNSFIVCSHIAERVDVETLKTIAKKYGVDMEHTREEQKAMKRELKKKIRVWKKCPCRMDFRNACRDPVTGETCSTVRAFMTPQPYDPQMLATSTRLPPGTIGVGRRQVAFHTGGPLPNSNDPHALELGRRDDGTMCVSVQYSPDPRPLPEYICTTVRDTQASLEGGESTGKTSNKGKKGSKKGKKKGKK